MEFYRKETYYEKDEARLSCTAVYFVATPPYIYTILFKNGSEIDASKYEGFRRNVRNDVEYPGSNVLTFLESTITIPFV